MAVTVTLTPFPPIPTKVCQPDQISPGDAATIPFKINRGGALKDRNVRRKNRTFTVEGLTGAELQQLVDEAEANLTAELSGQAPTTYPITSGGRTLTMYLVDVSAGGSLNIGSFETIPTATCIFETDEYTLT